MSKKSPIEILQGLIAEDAITSSRENAFFSSRPREVYKKENNKKSNYISREEDREERASSKVSGETCPLASRPVASVTPLFPLGEESFGQEALVSDITPAITSSRTFSGITAQHNISARGIKVSITLQQDREAATGAVIQLTAELKRTDRLRELKPYAGDNPFFTEFYQQLKTTIRQDDDADFKKTACLGRLHERGSRSAWIADMCVFGELDADLHLSRIVFYYDTES